MADRHDSRTGRDEHLSPTIPVDRETRDERTEREGQERAGAASAAARQKADAQGEADRKASDAAADKADVDAIAAKRKAEDAARVEAKKTAAERETERKARVAAGVDHSIGIDLGGGQVAYQDNPDPQNPKARTLTIGGLNFEHVSDDADGVWIYRAMK